MTHAAKTPKVGSPPAVQLAIFERSKHEFRFVRELQVHPIVQRKLDKAWARRIAAELDPDILGELSVVEENGMLLVFDGQHRLWACRTVLGEDQKVPCRIYQGLTTEHLSRMFLGVNRAKAVSAIDKWKQAVNAKLIVETTVEGILARRKLHVTETSSTIGGVRAVEALRHVYLRDGGEATLDRVLGLLALAWQRDPDAYDGTFLRALGLIVHRVGPELDDKRLAQKLAKTGGPSRMIGQARDYAKAAGLSVVRGMAEKILGIYNKGTRSSGLVLGR
jgi:hypothetical protein